jgi:hypothetical protein
MNHFLFPKDIPHRLTLAHQTLCNHIKNLLSCIKHLLFRYLNFLLHIFLILFILLILIILIISFSLQMYLTTRCFNLIIICQFLVLKRWLNLIRLFIIWFILRIVILRKFFLIQRLILNSFYFDNWLCWGWFFFSNSFPVIICLFNYFFLFLYI